MGEQCADEVACVEVSSTNFPTNLFATASLLYQNGVYSPNSSIPSLNKEFKSGVVT